MSDDAGSAEKEMQRRIGETDRRIRHAKIRDSEYRALLSLVMVSDPFPLDGYSHECILTLVNRYAELYGYDDWVEAYHKF